MTRLPLGHPLLDVEALATLTGMTTVDIHQAMQAQNRSGARPETQPTTAMPEALMRRALERLAGYIEATGRSDYAGAIEYWRAKDGDDGA